jgi:hypothetical protein
LAPTLGHLQKSDRRNPTSEFLKSPKNWVLSRTLAGSEPGFFNTGMTQQQLIQLFWHHPFFWPEALKIG